METKAFGKTTFGKRGLGVAPAIAAGVIASGAAIGGLLGLLQNSMDDDWADQEVFKSHARDIHSAMIGIQCLIGGAQTGKPLQAVDGNIICPGGTAPSCVVPVSLTNEWRPLRDGFGKFWAEVSGQWSAPSNAQAERLKDYARSFYRFYQKLAPLCRSQGVDVQEVPAPPAPDAGAEGNALVQVLKYTSWIVLGVGAIWGIKTLFDVFGKR